MVWVQDSEFVWLRGRLDVYVYLPDKTIREIDDDVDEYTKDPVLAGPFESLDAAKAAYLVMVA